MPTDENDHAGTYCRGQTLVKLHMLFQKGSQPTPELGINIIDSWKILHPTVHETQSNSYGAATYWEKIELNILFLLAVICSPVVDKEDNRVIAVLVVSYCEFSLILETFW